MKTEWKWLCKGKWINHNRTAWIVRQKDGTYNAVLILKDSPVMKFNEFVTRKELMELIYETIRTNN